MRFPFLLPLMLLLTVGVTETASAQQFGSGPRRELLQAETIGMPAAKMIIGAGERVFPSGARSPWHTAAGPKVLYLVQGSIEIVGTGGTVLLQCGPAPKVCLHEPQSGSWFFRNTGAATAKLLVVGLDPANRRTVHEMVGQVVKSSASRVTLAVGDLRTGSLAVPRKELTLSVADTGGAAAGDYVLTHEFDKKHASASGLVKLARPWE